MVVTMREHSNRNAESFRTHTVVRISMLVVMMTFHVVVTVSAASSRSLVTMGMRSGLESMRHSITCASQSLNMNAYPPQTDPSSVSQSPLRTRGGGRPLRGGGGGGAGIQFLQRVNAPAIVRLPRDKLAFWENMICGAVSRSIAQTLMHPANTMKTILQSNRRAATTSSAGAGGVNAVAAATGVAGSGVDPSITFLGLCRPQHWPLLCRGAGAQFVLSVPHGAITFAVLEYVRAKLNDVFLSGRDENAVAGPGLDFLSSSISTITVSVVATPQMMIVDNIMAGRFGNMKEAIVGIAKEEGVAGGFYRGWWPGLAGKIPSYALTWTFFQQLKQAQSRILKRPPRNIENSIMGCIASATTVCIMIPMDTIKTRLVTQGGASGIPYRGIVDAAVRITREEGVGAFYRGLPPRLISVVPMIGIQFGVYEFMKQNMLGKNKQNLVALDSRTVDGNNMCQRVNKKSNEEFPVITLDDVGIKSNSINDGSSSIRTISFFRNKFDFGALLQKDATGTKGHTQKLALNKIASS